MDKICDGHDREGTLELTHSIDSLGSTEGSRVNCNFGLSLSLRARKGEIQDERGKTPGDQSRTQESLQQLRKVLEHIPPQLAAKTKSHGNGEDYQATPIEGLLSLQDCKTAREDHGKHDETTPTDHGRRNRR